MPAGSALPEGDNPGASSLLEVTLVSGLAAVSAAPQWADDHAC
jgi:hypothetical protein